MHGGSWKAPLGLFLFSLFVRLIFLFTGKDIFLCYPPALDEDFYFLLVKLYKEKSPLVVGEPFYYSPLFFYILLILSYIGDAYMLYIKGLNIFIGSATSVVVFLILRNLGTSFKISLFISALFSFTDIFILYDLTSMKVSLGIFLFSLSILLLIRSNYFLGGLFLSASLLIYGGLLTACCLLFLYLLIKEWKKAFIFLLPILAVLLTTSLINYFRSGDLVLITAVDGIHFFIGNWKKSNGYYTPVPGVRPNPFGHYFDGKKMAQLMEGRNLKPSEVSKFWKSLALEQMKQNKVKAIKNFIRKTFLTVNHATLPNNYDISVIRKKTLLKIAFPFSLWIVLGISGLIISIIRKNVNPIIYILLLSCFLYLILFFVTDRYRLPMILLFALLSRDNFYYKSLKILLTALAISTILVFLPIRNESYNNSIHLKMAKFLCNLKAKSEETQYIFEKAKIYELMGDMYFKLKGREWANYYYLKALRLNPYSRRLREKLLNLKFD